MFDKFNMLAERLATSASRREFLGRFGRAALALAAGAAAIVALPALGDAAKKPPLVCDGYSYTGCIGRPEGSPCTGSFGITGSCRAPRSSTTCVCA